MLEFALVAPIIFIFLFAIVDFGMAMDRRLTLQHAVREGARMAAVKDDIQKICDHTVEQAQGMITAAAITLSYEDIDGNGRATDTGDAVTVTATYSYPLPIIGPALSGLFGTGLGSIDMAPSGAARLERSVSGPTGCP